MIYQDKYFFIFFLVLSISFSNEILFDEDNLFDNYAISLGGTYMFACNECDTGGDDGRRFAVLNRLNASFIIKANHRINLYYYPSGSDYGGFNFPDYRSAEYYQFGSQHFFKNKTPFKLNIDFFANYLFSTNSFYKKYNIGAGLSKKIESKDFKSFIGIIFDIYSYNLYDEDSDNSVGWSISFNYPIYMRVLPKDNIPSKVSYVLTPQIVIDTPNVDFSKYKDMYFNCSFNVSYSF